MAKIKVSGNIIDELSEKIPTHLVAINELIKNSFDAQASNVKIRFDSNEKKLSISDDGNGMDMSDIETLLHISKSNKEYAKIINGRYVQGSKGLGFLSVFKFGNSVTWKTSTNNSNQGYEFKVDYDDIIESENIEDIDIPILKKKSIPKGTFINISMTQENVSIFKQELEKPQTIKRLLYSFNVDNFHIELKVDDEKYNNSESLNFNTILPERQLFNVKYSSSDSKIVFYHNNIKAIEYDFPCEYNDFNLDLDLIIFSLIPYSKSKIDNIFYDAREELTPLIYINTNLFNNYTLFDTNVMQKIKYSSIMNQIIGNINIYSNNQNLEFNSDRTQFVQNKLTTNITTFIEKVNVFIQKRASENKKYLIDFNILHKNTIEVPDIENIKINTFKKYIKDDFTFKDNLILTKKNDKIIFSAFNKKATLKLKLDKHTDPYNKEKGNLENPKKGNGVISGKNNNQQKDDIITTPSIILKSDKKKYSIPSDPIDLYDFIESSTNSSGQQIDKDKITISSDDVNINHGVLKSINESCNINIEYKFYDPKTSDVITKLQLKFYEQSALIEGSNNYAKPLVRIPRKDDYKINFDNSISNLVNQINSLNPEKYTEVLSCSLRALFEISIDNLNFSALSNELNFKSKDGLDIKAEKVINYTLQTKKLSKIATNTKISFHTLRNILEINGLKTAISSANLGAHKSTQSIYSKELETLGIKAGAFLLITNELLKDYNK